MALWRSETPIDEQLNERPRRRYLSNFLVTRYPPHHMKRASWKGSKRLRCS